VGLAGEGETAAQPSSPAGCSSGSRSLAPWSTCRWVLLLDEPLGALDLKLRKGASGGASRTSSAMFGITFVYVTHDQEEALTMSGPDRGHETPAGSSRSAIRKGGLRPSHHHLRRRPSSASRT